MQTYFGGLFGVPSFNVNAQATACSPCGSKPLDIMLVLDRTGSMCTTDTASTTTGLHRHAERAERMDTFLRLMDPDTRPRRPRRPAASPDGRQPLHARDRRHRLRDAERPRTSSCRSRATTRRSTRNVDHQLAARLGDQLHAGERHDRVRERDRHGAGGAREGRTAEHPAGDRAPLRRCREHRADLVQPTNSPYRATPCHQGITSSATARRPGRSSTRSATTSSHRHLQERERQQRSRRRSRRCQRR